MERLKSIKETLVNSIQGQVGHLDSVDAKELGEVVDMVKDLSEAIYYCTITEAMNHKDKDVERHYYHDPYYYRDMDRDMGRMYYPNTYAANGGMSSGSTGSQGGSRNYTETMMNPIMRDRREGNSPLSRKTYMEAKEMYHDKPTKMKELEKYIHELGKDLTEMIEGASAEEKQMLNQKLTALASKI